MISRLHLTPLRGFLILVPAFLLFSNVTRGQGVYVPVTNLVYEYLEKMHTKGLTKYTRLVLPKTRTQISGYLVELDSARTRLTLIERDELDRYKLEYQNDKPLRSTSLKLPVPTAQQLDEEGFHLFKYRDSTFMFALYPILGIDAGYRNNESEIRRWNGLSAYGSYGEHFGAQTDFRDYVETGNHLDIKRTFTRMPGIIPLGSQSSGNSIGYSEVKGAVSYESPWLGVSIGREWFNWGSGYWSQLILSQKSPPFPYFRIDFSPVDWFRFYYIHGWLTSDVVDSGQTYPTQVPKKNRIIERPKYYAAHVVEVEPFNGLWFSFGESVVYSDQGPLLSFLIPVIFFRPEDQNYSGRIDGEGSNSQVFFDVNARVASGISCYGTWFIDEIDLKKIFDWPINRNQFGITVGTTTQDVLVDDLTLRAEYTRILPWVYSNYVQTQTYTNSGFLMGDYIGQNADQLIFQVDYRIRKGLGIKLWGEQTRRGGMDSVYYQYQPSAKPFLYGLKREDHAFGIDLTYEFILNCVAKLSYELRRVTDENAARTPANQLGSHHAYGVTLYYGL